MKKIISIAVVVLCLALMVVLFTACGDNKGDINTSTTDSTTQADLSIDGEDAGAEDVSKDDESTTLKEDVSTGNKKPSNSGSNNQKPETTKKPSTTKKPNTTKKPQSSSSSTKPSNSGGGVELATGDIYSGWF